MDGTLADEVRKARQAAQLSPAKGYLISLCTRANLTQSALAKLVGVSRGTLHNWDQGFTKPAPKHRERLLAVVGEIEAQLTAEAAKDGA